MYVARTARVLYKAVLNRDISYMNGRKKGGSGIEKWGWGKPNHPNPRPEARP